ncbi:alpha-D-glucose phosphate-specific phosphoglucomutase [Lachnospiraceae bacterium OttesenSCG-928-E19]|nr:alpha-D-glucose phosphate-specific phosphoglucomutase [Lachnospiraceae bacterium OttesenSCG-928-E19]
MIKTISINPYTDQNPGTSGLRRRTSIFMQPYYIESFIQGVLDTFKQMGMPCDKLVIGGDGRYPGTEFLPRILKVLIANGVSQILVIRDLVAPTPAISNIITKYKTDGGLALTASHNPAGQNGDFGIKIEAANGGGVNEEFTNLLSDITSKLTSFKTLDVSDDKIVVRPEIMHIDPISDYTELMKQLFDFDLIKSWFDAGHTIRLDAMNAASGPTLYNIFVNEFGCSPDWILRGTPLPDFGGIHPEPNRAYATDLYDFMMVGGADFGCAFDGDGDRNMVMGRGFYVGPSDCLAAMTLWHKYVPHFNNNFFGVARTRPTSSAVDLVADKMGINVYQTPTGWKYFANLLDDKRISLCGEESFGQGGDYIREKDGVFALLFWLSIMAATGKDIETIITDMWNEYGRVFYSQYAYEGVDKNAADQLQVYIRDADIVGLEFFCEKIVSKEIFEYTDPVTGQVVPNQGFEIKTDGGTRIFHRLSGTGTVGATLRFYIEKYSDNPNEYNMSQFDYLKNVFQMVDEIFKLCEFFGDDIKPTAVN